jgi:hypothetical protein
VVAGIFGVVTVGVGLGDETGVSVAVGVVVVVVVGVVVGVVVVVTVAVGVAGVSVLVVGVVVGVEVGVVGVMVTVAEGEVSGGVFSSLRARLLLIRKNNKLIIAKLIKIFHLKLLSIRFLLTYYIFI